MSDKNFIDFEFVYNDLIVGEVVVEAVLSVEEPNYGSDVSDWDFYGQEELMHYKVYGDNHKLISDCYVPEAVILAAFKKYRDDAVFDEMILTNKYF